ncbi:MAG: carbonic anhydrase [Empedobacter falsenii]
MGNITPLLNKIQPAVARAKKTFSGEMSSSSPGFIEAVCNENVKWAMDEIREKSPILKEMEQNKEILIVGGVYDMTSGKVEFL